MKDLMHADHLVSRCPFCGSWMWRGSCTTCWPHLRLEIDMEAS